MDAFLLNNDKESSMKADKTQMDAAKQGVVTPEMAAVAASEYLSPEFIRDGVASGEFFGVDLASAVILFNGAIHNICMLSDFRDEPIDPVPTVQLFLRSIQNNHE